MKREEIEIQVWEYIDGVCSVADRERIANLITTDVAWIDAFNELSALHQNIGAGLETAEPSLRFSKNVMEAIDTVKFAPSARGHINQWIIRGIAAVFIAGILTMLVYGFSLAHWSTATTSDYPRLTTGFSSFFSSPVITAIMFVNAILVLVLVDKLLRRKSSINATL